MLTPRKEAQWRKWIALYNAKRSARGQLSRRPLRHRLRQTGSSRRQHEGWPALLCVLCRALARPGGIARARQRALHHHRLLDREINRHRIRSEQSALRGVHAFSSARGRPARSDVTQRCFGRRPGTAQSGTQKATRLVYALASHDPVGRMGRLHRAARGARVSRDARLLRLVAHNAPSRALCACARRLAA